jgi:hypothetical protein
MTDEEEDGPVRGGAGNRLRTPRFFAVSLGDWIPSLILRKKCGFQAPAQKRDVEVERRQDRGKPSRRMPPPSHDASSKSCPKPWTSVRCTMTLSLYTPKERVPERHHRCFILSSKLPECCYTTDFHRFLAIALAFDTTGEAGRAKSGASRCLVSVCMCQLLFTF